MAAPTFVAEYETAWDTNTSPRTVSTTVAVDDLLVIIGVSEDSGTTLGTPSGGGLTYTLRQSVVVSSNCAVYVWTAPSASAQTFDVSITTSGGGQFGFNVLRWSGHGGVGASSKTNASGAPSLALSTIAANSAIVAAVGDWSAVDGASRTWRTINGITPTAVNGGERTYHRDSAHYAAYGGYWSDVGASGSKTTGLSAPTGQTYAIVAVEVLGSGGSSTNANAEAAAATATAEMPSAAVAVSAECATATTAAQDPAASVAAAAESAAATGTANDATIQTGSFTNAAAECATATAAANDPGAAVRASAEHAAATAVVDGAAASVGAAAALADAAAIVEQAALTIATGAEVAVVTGTAYNATVDTGVVVVGAGPRITTSTAAGRITASTPPRTTTSTQGGRL